MEPLRVVVCPDSFKGSLSASEVASAVADGVLDIAPDAVVTRLPMADGGEGTLTALLAVWGGAPRTVTTVDAIGRPTTARWALSPDGRTAVVELAEASGLPGVSDVPLQPLHASTRGTGDVARAALDAGVAEILLCLGGSASTDGGSGILSGLGARLLDADGREVPDGGEGLASVASLDLAGLHPRAREVRWRLAVDVTNPLVGEHGAAHVFGPQKGARDGVAEYLDDALRHWAQVLERETGHAVAEIPGAGAAGGVPAGLVAVLGAETTPGAVLVAETIGLPAALADADLVITGEGSFDSQSVNGKVADGVARLAAASPTRPPVVVVAGQVLLPEAQARAAGIAAAFSIAPGPVELDDLISRTGTRLRDLAAAVTSLTAAARR
ncbi:glycerate kinase [Promicromonospora thailandica]|uniref:Glycerate kinase n=1 Tax=Promicromonospora thailandica TaxID=765201 RepID=A0A9X2JVE4_9MICO|nr:glycerate kinase [Promicromonospora thailandica]MCP2264437.1 glycerate kinase [Promicromonospora thailandica]